MRKRSSYSVETVSTYRPGSPVLSKRLAVFIVSPTYIFKIEITSEEPKANGIDLNGLIQRTELKASLLTT
jgi:hypothetical protein